MKKLPVILLASSLLLAACGNNDSDKNGSSSNNNSSNSSNKKELNEATKKYEKYTDGQLDQFLKGTQKFVDAIHDNDMQKAKELYPKVRMYYERSEPVAEAFGDLDPKIDARLADMKEEKKDKKLSADIQKNFDKVNKLLDKYKDGDGYKSYNEVTKKDRKALSDAVNSLGEPLSKMAVVTE